ncbi:MAG: type II secretion system protein GspD, partial [Gammaproteobacteria bacterium]
MVITEKSMIKQLLILILMTTMVMGCESLKNDNIRLSKEVNTSLDDFAFDQKLKSTEPYVAEPVPIAEIKEELEERETIVYPGNDQQYNTPEAIKPIVLTGDAVTLNFEQAPLIDIVHAIMGDILELDYIVEHPISGEVTLRSSVPIPRDQLLVILETLLESNDALMIRDDDGRFIITSSGAAVKLRPELSGPKSKGAGYSTMIIPLQYIGAEEMASILKPLAPEDAFVRIDAKRSMLMMAGTRNQLGGWLDIVATFDIDMLKGKSVGIFPLEYVTADEIEQALSVLTGGSEGEGAAGMMSMIKIIPLERLNSIIVISPKAYHLEQVAIWIERLDVTPHSKYDRHLFVYSLQNSNAGHVAELLSSIFSGSGGSKAGGKSKNSGVAPGLTPETVSSTGKASSGSTSSPPPKGGGTSSGSVGSAQIVADEENNALLIYATNSEFHDIEQALKQLDVQPAQVLIEASIIEVALGDGLEYGVEWFVKNGLPDDHQGEAALTGLGIEALAPGFSYVISNAVGDLNFVLNALAKDSLINVISTPSVLVLDNNSAKIQVGNQQPVQSGTTITEGGTSLQSIEYKDTGVILTVTPSINASGLVTMDIVQNVTDVGEIDAATGQRSFLTRDVETKVAVRSGESVVLGGLIRDNKSLSNSGVPILKDIPWVGALFSTTSETNSRVELMIIITPHVVYNEQDLRDISR